MHSGTDKWWVGFTTIIIAIISAYTVANATPADLTQDSSATQQTAEISNTKPLTLAAAPQTSSTDIPAQQETASSKTTNDPDYHQARWNEIHFKPAIDKATNADCLKCHQEILDREVRETSPAGLKAKESLAWYQTLETYEGEQMTFHQRHLASPFIKKVANMQCTTCHQGNDPREEIPQSSATAPNDLTMRKMVDPDTCLMCHGQFPYETMGLPGPWHESGKAFQGNCMLCHNAFRTERHKVNFLKAEAIEKEGAANSDSCYGCHGGRAWYRTSYPYPRHAWPGMPKDVPEWAKDRPTESDLRFLIKDEKASAVDEEKTDKVAASK